MNTFTVPAAKCTRCGGVYIEDSLHKGHPAAHYCNPVEPVKIKEREFQLVEKPTSEAQKCINQWRHTYDVEIVSVQQVNSGYVTIALWRTPK